MGYKNAFQKRRCIVPVSGFFEWQKTTTTKKPFAIHLKEDPIMSLAGIWEHWVSQVDGSIVDSFTILTTPANRFMEAIHTRMPLILDPKDEQLWLNPSVPEISELSNLMKPCPPEWLDAFEISTLVNAPKNNSAEVLRPI